MGAIEGGKQVAVTSRSRNGFAGGEGVVVRVAYAFENSGRQDSNLRLRGPKPRALARLSYAPCIQILLALRHLGLHSWTEAHATIPKNARGEALADFSENLEQALEIVIGIEGQNDLPLLLTLQTDFDPG